MTAANMDAVAHMLARAFLFAAVFIRRYALPRDESYMQEHLVGTALWMPPDTWRTGPLAQLRMLPAMMRALHGGPPTPADAGLVQGFEVVEEWRYADDGPLLWRMWRAPHV